MVHLILDGVCFRMSNICPAEQPPRNSGGWICPDMELGRPFSQQTFWHVSVGKPHVWKMELMSEWWWSEKNNDSPFLFLDIYHNIILKNHLCIYYRSDDESQRKRTLCNMASVTFNLFCASCWQTLKNADTPVIYDTHRYTNTCCFVL